MTAVHGITATCTSSTCRTLDTLTCHQHPLRTVSPPGGSVTSRAPPYFAGRPVPSLQVPCSTRLYVPRRVFRARGCYLPFRGVACLSRWCASLRGVPLFPGCSVLVPEAPHRPVWGPMLPFALHTSRWVPVSDALRGSDRTPPLCGTRYPINHSASLLATLLASIVLSGDMYLSVWTSIISRSLIFISWVCTSSRTPCAYPQ